MVSPPAVISSESTYEWKAYALNNSYTLLGDIAIISGVHISQVKTVCHIQKWLLSLAVHLAVSLE